MMIINLLSTGQLSHDRSVLEYGITRSLCRIASCDRSPRICVIKIVSAVLWVKCMHSVFVKIQPARNSATILFTIGSRSSWHLSDDLIWFDMTRGHCIFSLKIGARLKFQMCYSCIARLWFKMLRRLGTTSWCSENAESGERIWHQCMRNDATEQEGLSLSQQIVHGHVHWHMWTNSYQHWLLIKMTLYSCVPGVLCRPGRCRGTWLDYWMSRRRLHEICWLM